MGRSPPGSCGWTKRPGKPLGAKGSHEDRPARPGYG
jgi:hypothetical protein